MLHWNSRIYVGFFRLKMKVILFFIIWTSVVRAEELFEPMDPPRAMGMGGASVAVSNDSHSIWTNPAGIARIRKARSRNKLHFSTFPGLILGANKEGQKLLTKMKFTSNSQAMSESIAKAIRSGSSQNPLWGRLTLNPMTFLESGKNKPIAMSLLASTVIKVQYLPQEGSDSIRVQTLNDLGGSLGIALTNRTNQLSAGIQIRPTLRYGFDDRISPDDLAYGKEMEQRIKKEANVGLGLGVDTGILWTLSDFWFPTVGMAIYNLPIGCKKDYLNPFTEKRQTICGTVYGGRINNPESLFLLDPTDIRLGVSIAPRLGRNLSLRLAFDMHHLYATDGTMYAGLNGLNPIKQAHGGVELFFANPLSLGSFALRAGMNQSFVTTGMSFRADYFSLEVAFYGKDINSKAATQKDSRWLLSLSSDF